MEDHDKIVEAEERAGMALFCIGLCSAIVAVGLVVMLWNTPW